MDKLLLVASSSPFFLGLDANASWSMWFSKISRHTSEYQSHSRGKALSERMVAKNLYIANEPSEWYTYDGPRCVSDIDMKLMNPAADRAFVARCEVKGGWGLSDHNLIQCVKV